MSMPLREQSGAGGVASIAVSVPLQANRNVVLIPFTMCKQMLWLAVRRKVLIHSSILIFH